MKTPGHPERNEVESQGVRSGHGAVFSSTGAPWLAADSLRLHSSRQTAAGFVALRLTGCY
jgi:hypothetical protein